MVDVAARASIGPIVVVLGTRPEAIKLAPVVLALRKAEVPHRLVVTGQHADLVREALALFDLVPDVDLKLMRTDQTLDYLLASATEEVGRVLDRLRPSAVVVQGDTTSMLGAAVAAFHRCIPVAHVEAGLRSGDINLPFPEEANRRLASVLATWHFAPTRGAATNLRAERAPGEIHVVGNTVVDALQLILAHDDGRVDDDMAAFVNEAPYLLATAHRRESWDGGIDGIARGLAQALRQLPDHRLLFVTHPNPVARAPVDAAFADEPRARVVVALPYAPFLRLMRGARLVVSDSGGVQEEGPTLGVPVLVTRAVTERPEGVDAGAVRLVGTDAAAVRDMVLDLLRTPAELERMSRAGGSIYGDGAAADRIVSVLLEGIGRR